MGSGHSTNIRPDKFSELVFERGEDSLAVEVHSAEFDEEHVTVFTYLTDSLHRAVSINTVQTHKVLRHPCILKLITCTDPGSKTHIVTESATPLSVCLEYVTGWEISVGLSKILEALHFLHTVAGFTHNNVSLESIYVTPDGRWKLGRLDCCRKFTTNSADYIKQINALLDPDVYPVKNDNQKVLLSTYCRDMNGFGKVCEQLLGHLEDFDSELLSDFNNGIDLMVSENTDDIPTAEEILAQPLLNNSLVLNLKFIEEISIKSSQERAEFFSTLVDSLRELPEIVIAKLLVRPLLRRFVVEDKVAYTTVLPALLTPKTRAESGGLLSPPLYKIYVPPVLYRLFTVKEYSVRALLLRHFHSYCDQMDKLKLQKFVMPLILQGLHDSYDSMVSLSLVALADLVPVLGGEIVIGTERKEFFINTGKIPSTVASNNILYKKDRLVEKVEPIAGRSRRERPPRKPREREDSHKEKPKLGTRTKSTLDENKSVDESELKRETETSIDDSEKMAAAAVEATDMDDLPGSPVGSQATSSEEVNGEDGSESESSESESSESDTASDWDEEAPPAAPTKSSQQTISHSNSAVETQSHEHKGGSLSLKAAPKVSNRTSRAEQDFSKLDIKSNIVRQASEMDFFADMMPNVGQSKMSSIQASNMSLKTSAALESKTKPAINLAYALADGGDTKNGWGAEEDGWDW